MGEDGSIRLTDGRRLAFRRAGAGDGYPIFYFHGWPGSRLEIDFFEEDARLSGATIWGLDRPGMGRSDFQKGRRLLDWPEDVLELADYLGLETFSVAGVSGGGPYAAACAYRLPERLDQVGIVAGLGPVDRPQLIDSLGSKNRRLFRLARRLPRLGRLLMAPAAASIRRRPQLLRHWFKTRLAQVDWKLLNEDQEVSRTLFGTIQEGLRQGARGAAWEGHLYCQSWGFDLSAIRVPVHLWHGDADRNVPAFMSRYLHKQIPGSKLQILPGEGHLTMGYKLKNQILQRLLPA